MAGSSASTQAQPSQRLQQLLSRHQRVITLVIAAAAAVIHLAYVLQIASGPLALQRQFRNTDMQHYDGWARSIAAGDIWSTGIELPRHSWHRTVGRAFLKTHPEAAQELDPTGRLDANALADRLWDKWVNPRRFYQEPGYPYLLAALYTIFGAAVLPVFLCQAVLGTASVVLIRLISRRAFGETASLAAAMLALIAPSLVVYDATILRTSLIICSGLAAVWTLQRATTPRSWLIAGLVLGAAMTVKSHVSLIGLPAAWAAFRSGDRSRGRWLQLAGLLTGIALSLVPTATRNLAVGEPPLAPPSGGYFVFIGANAPQQTINGVGSRPDEVGELIAASRGSLLSAISLTIGQHDSLFNFLALQGRKLLATLSWFEIPNNTNLYFFQQYSSVLAMLPVSFTAIGSLGLVGLVLAVRQAGQPDRGRLWPLLALVAVNAAVLVGFYVFARYRVALTAAIMPFAGLTVCEALRCWSDRAGGRLAAIAVTTCILAGFIGRPLPPTASRYRPADSGWVYETFCDPLVKRFQREGNLRAAAATFDRFLTVIPPPIAQLANGQPSVPQPDPQLIGFYSSVFEQAAASHGDAGNQTTAQSYADKAARLRAAADGPL